MHLCDFKNIFIYRTASSAVDRGFEPRSGQTIDNKIGISCFTKHATRRSKNKDWLAWNQDNVSEWSDMLFQRATTIEIQLSVMV